MVGPGRQRRSTLPRATALATNGGRRPVPPRRGDLVTYDLVRPVTGQVLPGHSEPPPSLWCDVAVSAGGRLLACLGGRHAAAVPDVAAAWPERLASRWSC